MLDFFQLGEFFLGCIDSLYDFFFSAPVALRSGLYDFIGPIADFFGWEDFNILYNIGTYSPAEPASIVYYVFGGGLVFILIFKFIKFFVDLVL